VKFIAVQTGARRGYAVPAILERAGMLERFYTDVCGNVGLGRRLSRGKHLPLIGSRFARLGTREVPGNIVAKTYTFESAAVQASFFDLFGSKDPVRRFQRRVKIAAIWARAMIRQGFGSATHVYSMLNEGGEFLTEAHRRGLKVVAEIYILLATEQLMLSERRAFPNWEPEAPDYASLRRRFLKEDIIMTRTHSYICPSEAVRDDLVRHWGVAIERTKVVPYGVNPRWLALEPKPIRGRVLFVGTAGLRKGIHYLAMATEKLICRGRNYEFRVAGNVTDQVRRQPICRHLNFIGRVPRDRIHQEFQQADVFVLPSLAEGSAEVTYEAAAAGVPVVTTRAAGSIVRDDIEGRIVQERDLDALADAVEQIVENRALRDQMAHAARERAQDYTWEQYGERLVTALKHLANEGDASFDSLASTVRNH
jgi:glycosyltransferase involved in cell wall biosynthesis